MDGILLRELLAEGAAIFVGLLVVVSFWTLCALVAHRQNLRRERRGLK